MSGAAAALHSDHINLLVFRYLQEIGFENAATAFYTDWHRPQEFRDPETYPFAPSVQRNELVSVIQTGLSYDELQARIRKQERRFRWTGADARDSIERQERGVENGAASRPSSSSRRKARAPGARPLDDFATPAPKRQRRSEGSEARVNGDRDAMDVDATSGDAEAETEGDAASPTVQSEPEPMEEVQRYDSMDVATQTEIKAGPKTSTIYWKVDKPAANILHSTWNPDSNPKNTRTLLTVGDSICRFYQVPDTIDDAGQITHVDEPALPVGTTVTASTWRPDGSGASCAFNGIRELPDGTNVASHMLIEHHREKGAICFQIEPQLLDPPGVVLGLRYSPNTAYLLVAITNGQRGLVQIWKTPRDGVVLSKTQREPIAWRVFENVLLDVTWIEDDMFLACGAGGLSAMYQVDQSRQREIAAVEPGTVAMRGLISHNSSILPDTRDWDKVRWDGQHQIAVFASSLEKKMIICPRLRSSEGSAQRDQEVDLPEEPTAIAFKPWERPTHDAISTADQESPSLLAAAFVDGTCVVYSINRSADTGAKYSELISLSLDDGPALAVAWSPSGRYLAVGNSELVQIWSADLLRRQNGVRHAPQASVIWRPASEVNGVTNGQSQDDKMPEPSLSWSADGESLAYAVDKQIAVIRFRPALNGAAQENEPNGRLSP
ncbi:WD repeat [Lecanosticta acicola]|uniref:WD repeat n=1 Tax=Lecanosticta acicola TaxID=111012 RepID=A0AAI9E8Q9_9PEZI|nr:WD repeat [Lecanosticta acicola]